MERATRTRRRAETGKGRVENEEKEHKARRGRKTVLPNENEN